MAIVKFNRIQWAGRVKIMDDSRYAERIARAKPYGKTREDRIKWIEDVEADLQKLSIIGWTFIASDREDIARKSLIHIGL